MPRGSPPVVYVPIIAPDTEPVNGLVLTKNSDPLTTLVVSKLRVIDGYHRIHTAKGPMVKVFKAKKLS